MCSIWDVLILKNVCCLCEIKFPWHPVLCLVAVSLTLPLRGVPRESPLSAGLLFQHGTFCFCSGIRKCSLFIDLTEGEYPWKPQLVRRGWLSGWINTTGKARQMPCPDSRGAFRSACAPWLCFPGPRCAWVGAVKENRNSRAQPGRKRCMGTWVYSGDSLTHSASLGSWRQELRGEEDWVLLWRPLGLRKGIRTLGLTRDACSQICLQDWRGRGHFFPFLPLFPFPFFSFRLFSHLPALCHVKPNYFVNN